MFVSQELRSSGDVLFAFLCATSVFSVSLWLSKLMANTEHRDAEEQRLHGEEAQTKSLSIVRPHFVNFVANNS